MKIAIHHSSGSYSDQWISICKESNIPYKVVNAYDNDIINTIEDCDVFMWHHHQENYKDALIAKSLLFSIEQAGKAVFPNFNTGWHFDDKLGQKYLLESIGAPLVPTYIFYDKRSALDWCNSTSFPKVFKLKGGAGARNVKLVRSKKECVLLINKAFGRGFRSFDVFENYRERVRKYKEGKDSLIGVLKGIARIFIPTDFARFSSREKGYIYFQEFIPNNEYDIRLIVINQKYAYGMKRINRANDFRASGSSNFKYDDIPEEVLKIAFRTSSDLNIDSAAFDFIFDQNGKPLIVELSYGFGLKGSSQCPGYWTSDLSFHKQKVTPFRWMIERFL